MAQIRLSTGGYVPRVRGTAPASALQTPMVIIVTWAKLIKFGAFVLDFVYKVYAMIKITKAEFSKNPANINENIYIYITVKEIDQQAKFPLRILRNLGVYFGLDTNK